MPIRPVPDELHELRCRIEQMQAKLDDWTERLKKLSEENVSLKK